MYYQKCLNLQYFLLNLVLDPIKCILYICLKLRVLFEDRVINSYKINNLQTFENLAYIRLAEEGFGLGKSNGGWVELKSIHLEVVSAIKRLWRHHLILGTSWHQVHVLLLLLLLNSLILSYLQINFTTTSKSIYIIYACDIYREREVKKEKPLLGGTGYCCASPFPAVRIVVEKKT